MEEIRYNEFLMRIENRKKVWVQVPEAPDFEEYDINIEGLTFDTLNFFNNLLATERIKNSEELEVIGTHLYEALFIEDINALYETEEKNARDDEKNILRLRLIFEEDASELGELPWEYLYHPYDPDKYFVSTRTRIVLTRFIDNMPEIILKPDKIPLRIIIAVSYPKAFEKNKQAAEQIYTSMKKLQSQEPKDFRVDLYYTFEQIKNRIDKVDFHVLHLFCQGRMENGEGSLLFLDDKSNEKWISASTFAKYFKEGEPRLIFLHLIGQTEVPKDETSRAFRDVANKLVAKGAPAVITMQYPIVTDLDKKFVEAFYKSLGYGKSIGVAVLDGRSEVEKYQDQTSPSSQSFGSPIVFLQNDMEIIRRETEKPEIKKVECPITDCKKLIQDGDKSTRLKLCPDCAMENRPSKIIECECGYWPIHEILARKIGKCPQCERIIQVTEQVDLEPTDAIEGARLSDQTATYTKRDTKTDWRNKK